MKEFANFLFYIFFKIFFTIKSHWFCYTIQNVKRVPIVNITEKRCSRIFIVFFLSVLRSFLFSLENLSNTKTPLLLNWIPFARRVLKSISTEESVAPRVSSCALMTEWKNTLDSQCNSKI